MKDISKKIKNILVIKGTNIKLNSFEEELKRLNKNVILVPYTKKMTSNFINQNWKIEISKLNKVVLYSRLSSGKIILFFNNEKFENELLDLIIRLKLNAQYNVYINLGREFLFLQSFYKKGLFIGEDETPVYSVREYSIANCLA